MTRAKHRSGKRTHSGDRRRTGAPSRPDGPLLAVLKLLVAALLVARLLVPTESAAQGETLWLVQLWLAAGLLWAWDRYREGDFRVRWNGVDAWLWVLIAGHLVSALAVLATEGQKRAALNMLWEWIGLGVGFFLLRQVLRSIPEARRLLVVLVATATALAGLGIYQHYVWYPRAQRDYEAVRSELDRLLEGPQPHTPLATSDRQQRINELRGELSSQGIPLERSARVLWENRLSASREPFGMFALANTLAGMLLAWLLVGLGLTFDAWRDRGRWFARVGSAVAIGMMGFCLVLTKSRTAWVGLLAGLLIWGWLCFRRSARSGRIRWLAWTLSAVVLVAAVVAVAGLSGGLDRAVLTEAPKSLRYRLQYWTGAAEVVREYPYLGVGPGNFRQHYLKYKLAESSEEIFDPHNAFLDVWTSGGLIGLMGLLGLLFVGGRAFVRANPPETTARANSLEVGGVSILWSPLVCGGGLGFLMVLGAGWLIGLALDIRLAALLAAFVVSAWALQSGRSAQSLSRAPLAAAAAGLVVHLLGAGGIEMPAIPQTLLILLAATTVHEHFHAEAKGLSTRLGVAAIACSMLVLLIGCFTSACLPVLNRASLVRTGDAALLDASQWGAAERFFRDAAEADPLSPQPAARLAELAFRRWNSTLLSREFEFERAVELQRMAISLDPHSSFGHRRLGRWWLARFERTGERAHAKMATEWLSKAIQRYPTHATTRADLAEALDKANRPKQAAGQARRALELDVINRSQGHRDKYLSEVTREKLNQIILRASESRSAESDPN